MRKLTAVILFLISVYSVAAQKRTNRLFINSGAGPSYSLFYKNGGWVRDFGQANTGNITVSRDVWAFSQFAELEWRLKNPRWSLRAGFATHRFYPRFKRTGTTTNGTYYDIDTKEADRYSYPQVAIHYALVQGINRLEVGLGFYNQINKRQTINYYNNISVQPGTSGNAFFIKEYTGHEGGIPFNVDYIHFLNNGSGLGARLNFNYTQSLRTAEHIALQLFFKTRLR
jgi:hypothetical protein